MPGVGSLRWACTFHASGDANSTQRKPVFRWNMGLKPILLYAFLTCVGLENAKEFALATLQFPFFTGIMITFSDYIFII